MKEQTDSHSLGEATSFIESKKDTLNKKKLIAKNKPDFSSIQHTEKATKKLSKEERAKIQKEKNREAAQRSRDIHKEYVNSLQLEVKTLREKVQHSARYCHRCQQIINLQQPPLQNEDVGIAFGQPELQKEDISQKEDNRENLEPESFLRWLEPQEELPLMKILLLVCMIAITIIVGANSNQKNSDTRMLVQKYQEPLSSNIPSPMTFISSTQDYTQEERALVQLNQGLSNQKCLDSLMKVQGLPTRKNMRSMHEAMISEDMSNIMLCSLKTPQLYEFKQELTDSPVVRLFLSGSDIKKMTEGSESMQKMAHRNIQLNGIYRLAAEIKSVQLLQHHSCII